MSFPQLPPAGVLAVLLLVAALIVALHWLRPRAVRAPIASNLLWARVLEGAKRRSSRWRWWLALLLALVIGLSLAAAAWWRDGWVSGRDSDVVLIVVDNSPSMHTRMSDGRTRWQHAVARAEQLIATLPLGAAVALADTMGLMPAGDFAATVDSEHNGYATARHALDTLRQIPLASTGTPRLPPMLIGAASRGHLFTDGVTLKANFADWAVHPVFESADNVALTAFDVKRSVAQPGQVDALVQVYNAGARAKRVRVLLRGQGHFSLEQSIDLDAAEMADLTFDVTGCEPGVLAAAASAPDDAYPLDDIAYAVVPRHAMRDVVLVTPGNPRLEDSLRALPGVRLTTLPPAQYRADARFDAYVFDRFAPSQSPPAGALLLGAPAVGWLPLKTQPLRDPRIAHWDARHPASADVRWSNLRLRSAHRIDSAGLALVKGGDFKDALVVAFEAPVRAVYTGFALDETNLALQPALPVFLGHVVDWISDRASTMAAAPGLVAVPIANATVIDGSGTTIPGDIREAGITRFAATQPDVYIARNGTAEMRVVVNRFDPSSAEVNRSPFADAQPGAASLQSLTTTHAALWMILLFAAGALLLFDWFAYLRRITL